MLGLFIRQDSSLVSHNDKKHMKKLLLLFLFIFLPFLFPKPTFADTGNFAVSTNVTYTVNSSGNTHVAFAVTLKNTTDKYYASSYTIHLGFQNIHNVTASDTGGSISPQVKNTSDGETITVPFNVQVAGLNKTLPFQIGFDTSDVATLNGSIWEVNIPGLSDDTDFTNFTVHVVVPGYFGNPTYIKPNVGNNNLTFTKDQLGTSGISLAFGDKEVYTTNLTYHLQNTQLFPVRTEIALPPDTTYQHVEIDSISPKPQNVILDADGNWLAQYQLAPSQTVTVLVKGKVYNSLTPQKESLSDAQQKLYTEPDRYWQTKDSKIQALAQTLKTPQAIFDYVVKNLTYDFARVSDTQNRLGAVGVLQHPNEAVCLEFTDLFIALSRAVGIPARELDGYAYTQNTVERPLSLQKEVLHAWPEYYDKVQGTWIMVDPTWENTTGGVDYFHTFDYDHLAFVIKGVNSSYPVPAGGYKIIGQTGTKDIDVSFAPESVAPDPTIQVGTNFPESVLAGLPIQGGMNLMNNGQVLFPSQEVFVNSLFSGKQSYVLSAIPPFGHTTITLSLGAAQILTNTIDPVTIQLAGKTVSKSIQITAFSPLILIILGGFIIVILSIIISIVTRRSRRVSVPQQKWGDSVRGESQKSQK